MENDLPVKIIASQHLLKKYNKLGAVVNRQEAHVNFQTLSAGWYEDETNIVSITIHLLCAKEFQKKEFIDNLGEKQEISDDVVNYTHNNYTTCFIAITDKEAKLLDKEPKLLSGYLTVKIKKVINEIAKQKGLLALPF